LTFHSVQIFQINVKPIFNQKDKKFLQNFKREDELALVYVREGLKNSVIAYYNLKRKPCTPIPKIDVHDC